MLSHKPVPKHEAGWLQEQCSHTHTCMYSGTGWLKLISFKACDTLIRGSHQDRQRTAGPCMHKEMTFESCVLCVLRHRPGCVPNTSLQARSPARTARVVAPGPSEPPSSCRAASAILWLISHQVTPFSKCEELGVIHSMFTGTWNTGAIVAFTHTSSNHQTAETTGKDETTWILNRIPKLSKKGYCSTST